MTKLVKDEGLSHTKLFLTRSLTLLLTTANYTDSSLYTFVLQDQEIISQICELLVTTCRSGELLSISYALDGFYEIFSEDFYDSALQQHGVIGAMEAGQSTLEGLREKAEDAVCQFSEHELGTIEDALANVAPFIEYKKEAFSKQNK